MRTAARHALNAVAVDEAREEAFSLLSAETDSHRAASLQAHQAATALANVKL